MEDDKRIIASATRMIPKAFGTLRIGKPTDAPVGMTPWDWVIWQLTKTTYIVIPSGIRRLADGTEGSHPLWHGTKINER